MRLDGCTGTLSPGRQLAELQATQALQAGMDASDASQALPTGPVAMAAEALFRQSASSALKEAAPPSGAGDGGTAAELLGCLRRISAHSEKLRQWQSLIAKLQQSLDRELQRMDELCAAIEEAANASSRPADALGGALFWPEPQKVSASSVLPLSAFEVAAALGASCGDEGGQPFEDEAAAALSARLLQLVAQASAPLAAAAPDGTDGPVLGGPSDASGAFGPLGGQKPKEEQAAAAATAEAASAQGQALAAALAGAAPAPAADAEVAAQAQASAWGLLPLGSDEASVQSTALLQLATLAAMPPLEVGQVSEEQR